MNQDGRSVCGDISTILDQNVFKNSTVLAEFQCHALFCMGMFNTGHWNNNNNNKKWLPSNQISITPLLDHYITLVLA